MAGTSGCIPDYHVNFFGQFCEPASRLSGMTSPEPGPQLDFEQQSKNVPVPSSTADHAPAPDPVAELFEEYQSLIRGLSCGNVETYLATVKDVFADVRQSRKNACTEMPTEQCLAESHQVGKDDKSQAKCPDPHQITNGDQHQNRQQVEREPEHKYQRKEQCQIQKEDQDPEQIQIQHQPQPRSRSPTKSRGHNFIIAHHPKDKGNSKLPRQAISPRSITAGKRYHAMHAIQ